MYRKLSLMLMPIMSHILLHWKQKKAPNWHLILQIKAMLQEEQLFMMLMLQEIIMQMHRDQ
jgi:hypothetical protein